MLSRDSVYFNVLAVQFNDIRIVIFDLFVIYYTLNVKHLTAFLQIRKRIMYYYLNETLKYIFLLTPFFVLSMYLSYTQGWTSGQRYKLAVKITVAAFVACMILFFFGGAIFAAFGITLDAFRIGGGALLFLSAVGLVNGSAAECKVGEGESENSDIAVVPLAIPVTVGPGTTGALLVMGAETTTVSRIVVGCLSLITALVVLMLILLLGTQIQRFVGKRGIVILSKVTGLFLAAMASQMIFTGIRNFIH